MKRKRKSDIETVKLEKDDGIDRQSPSYSNNASVIQNSNILGLEDNGTVSSPSKRAKLSTEAEHNNNQLDTNNENERGIKSENNSAQNGVEIHERDNTQRNSIHRELLQNGIESKQSDVDEIVQSNRKIIQDYINNIEMIIDNFKDVIEIRGTQMVIGNFVIEYSDYQKFLTLLNKLVDILEKNDSEKLLQSAKKVGYKGKTGQVLNPKLFRTKISKRAYKCLNEFQDDFTCTCNDAIAANPEKHDIGMQFLKFGIRLFEQAYKELPSSIRQLCERDENFDAKKGTSTKRLQKVALIQPTLDGHVFSSGAIKQLSLENDVFQLVGDLQDMSVVSSQSMDEQEIPTIGSILPKREDHEFSVSEEPNIPGVKFHKYKAYASFAPICDSSAAMLSYEDTILTCTYKRHSRYSDDSDLSEEEEEELSNAVSEEESPNANMVVSEGESPNANMVVSEEESSNANMVVSEEESSNANMVASGEESSNMNMVISEEINQMENFGTASSSKQNDSGNDIFMENTITNENLFEDIDIDLLYKNVKGIQNTQPNEDKQSTQSNEENEIDKILDENVEIFKKIQSMQEERLIGPGPNVISEEERELAIKLQKKLANIISEISPSELVSFDAVENAMDNLPIKEKSFKGMLPPDKSFAHPTNEVSRDAFGSFSGIERSSEDTEQAYTTEYTRSDNVPILQMKSEEALPHVPHQALAGSSSITPSHQSVSSQSLHHSIPLPVPASMTYPSRATASQVPMRMSYGVSQGMSTQMHASYQMTYPRSLSASSHVPSYYPSQRYPPSYGYSYYPSYGYSMNNSTWNQRPSYY